MKILPSLLFSLLAFSFLLDQASSFQFSANYKYVSDLENTKASAFYQETLSWVPNELECTLCSPVFIVPSKSCYGAGTPVLSGPNILATTSNRTFERMYVLAPETDPIPVALQIDVWLFSSIPLPNPEMFLPMISSNGSFFLEYNATKIGSCETVGYSFTSAGSSVVVNAIYHYRMIGFDFMGLDSLTMVDVQDINSQDTKQLSVGFRDLKMYLNASECFVPETFPCCNSSYWDGSTCAACDPSCYACTGPGANQCTICNASFWTFPDGSCSSTCDFPFVQDTSKSPYYKLCETLCNSSVPYLEDNQTCRTTCPAYMLTKNIRSIKRCMIPCNSSTDYFFETDQICQSTCEDFPYQEQEFEGIKVCYLAFALSIAEVKQTKALSASMTSQGSVTGGGMKASSAMNSNSPSIVLLASICGMLNYIKYMNINYPDKLKLLFYLQNGSPISISFSIGTPQSVQNLKTQHLPENFKQYDVHSNFLYNYWETLITFAIIMVIILLFFVLKGVTKKGSRARSVFSIILGSLKWNIPLMILSGSFGDMFFYASIHLRIPVFETGLDIVSHFLCIGMIILGLSILLVSYKSVEELRKKRDAKNSIEYEKAQEKWKDYKFLYEEYEDKYFIGQAFMTLFLFRVMIFNMIVANLWEYPLLQAVLINVLNIAIFSYLIYLRPLKALFETFQMFVNELLFLVANVCMLILAIMDQNTIQDLETRNQLGQAILIINIMFPAVSLALFVVQVLIACYSFYQFQKRQKAQGIRSYYKMLKIYLSEAFPSKGHTAKVAPSEETSQIQNEMRALQEESSRITLQEEGSQRKSQREILARSQFKRRQTGRLLSTSIVDTKGDDINSLEASGLMVLDNSRSGSKIMPMNQFSTFDPLHKTIEKDKIFSGDRSDNQEIHFGQDGLNNHETQLDPQKKSSDFL